MSKNSPWLIKADELLRQARLEATSSKIKEAISSLIEAADMYSKAGIPTRRAYCLGSAGYLAVLHRQLPHGLSLLDQAAKHGFHELTKIEQLGKLRYGGRQLLHNRSFSRISETVRRNMLPVDLIEICSDDVDRWQWMRFTRPDYLSRLRKRLPSIKSRSDLKIILGLTAWVHNRFGHDPANKPSSNDALTILSESKTKTGFTCQEYSILLAAALQACSIPARVVALLRRNYQSGHGRGHWAVEAWCDALDKWLLVDPQNNLAWAYQGALLNAFEAREYYLEGKKRYLLPIRNAKPVAGCLDWAEHFDSIWYYQNQSFSSQWNNLGKSLELSDNPQPVFQNRFRSEFRIFKCSKSVYPLLNKVSISLAVRNRIAQLRLRHSFPFFRTFQFSFNNGAWSNCSSFISRKLINGDNGFSFRVKSCDGSTKSGASCCLMLRG